MFDGDAYRKLYRHHPASVPLAGVSRLMPFPRVCGMDTIRRVEGQEEFAKWVLVRIAEFDALIIVCGIMTRRLVVTKAACLRKKNGRRKLDRS